MNIEDTAIFRIQRWYVSMADGDWHHTYGIRIGNIDNPGWSLHVDLKGTYLYDIDFNEVVVQRKEENDWINCKTKEGVFQGYGGSLNLDEMLCIFLDWAESHDR